MANFLTNTVERLLFHSVTVSDVTRIGERFHLASLQGEVYMGASWTPGQSTNFLVGSLTKRTYTPMDVDPRLGSAKFLFYQHGQGPGSAWASTLRAGGSCKVMRLKDSVDFTKDRGPALFFGDETSFAAAQSLQQCPIDRTSCHLVFEVDSLADARQVVSKLQLKGVTLIQKAADNSHLVQAANDLYRLRTGCEAPFWFFTGSAISIQTLRKHLKDAKVSFDKCSVKPYWVPGKSGRD